MSKLRRLREKEKGQALVEFALVLPILLIVVCGIIDYGWYFYNLLSLQNACREGARRACVISQATDCEDQIRDKIKENLPEVLKKDLKVTVKFSTNVIPDRVDGDVTVTASSRVYFLTPVLGTVYKTEKGGKFIESELVMKVEQ